MVFILDLLYAALFILALPFLAFKSWRTGKYRSDWAARFGRGKFPLPGGVTGRSRRRLMIHCVSVGELLSVRKLIDRLLALNDSLQIIVTTTTDTGTARAKEIFGQPAYRSRVFTTRFPLDFSFAVRPFLNAAAVDLIALVELETWPNFIRIAAGRAIPVAVINGRMTQRSFSHYRWVRPIVAGMLHRIAWLGIQTPEIARRFQALGAPPARMAVIPTLKYDAADIADRVPGDAALALALGIAAQHALIVGGSTGPGEEVMLIQSYLVLRKDFPGMRLAIAPRKPESVPLLLAALRDAGLNAVRRSTHPDSAPAPPLDPNDVAVLDTMGELKKLYSLAAGVFVGRSLIPLGGSDMIEAAALAKPVCFGPYTANFSEAAALLTSQHAAVVVPDALALTAQFRQWLEHPREACAMGSAAQRLIAAQRGSTEIYAQKLLEMMPAPRSNSP